MVRDPAMIAPHINQPVAEFQKSVLLLKQFDGADNIPPPASTQVSMSSVWLLYISKDSHEPKPSATVR